MRLKKRTIKMIKAQRRALLETVLYIRLIVLVGILIFVFGTVMIAEYGVNGGAAQPAALVRQQVR